MALPLAPLATAVASGIGIALRVSIVAAILKVFLSIGIGFFAFQAITPLLDDAEAYVIQAVTGMGSPYTEYAALLKLDAAITIVFSAITVAASIKGLRLIAR